MKWRTFDIQRTPGFRINLTDIGLLLLLAAVAAVCRLLLPDSSLFGVPLYLALSFFLFCNVFRIGNRLEPFWYVPFTLAAAYAVLSMNLRGFWWAAALFLEPLKWALIGYRMKRGPYTGIGYRRFGSRPLESARPVGRQRPH